MGDNRIFHLRRIGPPKTLPIAVDHMDFTNSVSIIGRGRDSGVDFIIDSANRNRKLYISRIHARVVKLDNRHILHDDSRNGVFVNNLKIGESTQLNEGDRVTFGHHNGESRAIGTRLRQPDSEYQFIFEKCNCGLQNQGRQTAMGSRTLTIIDSINNNACMPRGYNTEVPMTTSVQRQTVNNSTNETPGIICNRPCHTEMSTEGMHVHNSLINDNFTSNYDLPTIAMDENSLNNNSNNVTKVVYVRDEDKMGTSTLKNGNSHETDTSLTNDQGLETVSLNGNTSDVPCMMRERIVSTDMSSGEGIQNMIGNDIDDDTRELSISLESIQESNDGQVVESVESFNEKRNRDDASLQEVCDSVNSEAEHQSHPANFDEKEQGYSANSGKEDQGRSGEEAQGHSVEEDQGLSADFGEGDPGHSAKLGKEENQGHSDYSGEEDQGHSANLGEEVQGENGNDQNIEEFGEENRKSESTAEEEENGFNDLNVSEMFDESFDEMNDDLTISENDNKGEEDGDDQLDGSVNRKDNSESDIPIDDLNQNNVAVNTEDNGESSIVYSSSIDYSLVDICQEDDNSQNNDQVENEVVRSDENSDQDNEEENVDDVGENCEDDDDVDENTILRDTESVESCSIEYNDLDRSSSVDSNSDNYDEPSFIDLDVSELESEDEDHEESVDENQEESVDENQEISVGENQEKSVDENQEKSVDENQEESVDKDHEESVDESEEGEQDEITVLKMKIREEEEKRESSVNENPEDLSFSEESGHEEQEESNDEEHEESEEGEEDEITVLKMNRRKEEENSASSEDESSGDILFSDESCDKIEDDGDHVICDEKDNKFEENIEDNENLENVEDDRNIESFEDNENPEIQEDQENKNISEDHENQEGFMEDENQVYNQESNAKDESLDSFANDQNQKDIGDNGRKENFHDDDDYDDGNVEEECDDGLECSMDDVIEECVESSGNEDYVVEDFPKVIETPNRKDHDSSSQSIEHDQEIVEYYEVEQNVVACIETPKSKEDCVEDEKQKSVDQEKQECVTKENFKVHENPESQEVDKTQDIIEVHGEKESEEIGETQESKDHKNQKCIEFDGKQKSIEVHDEDHKNLKTEKIDDHKEKEREKMDGTQNSIEVHEEKQSEDHKKQESEEIEDHKKQESEEIEDHEEIDGTQSLEVHDNQESKEIEEKQSLEVHEEETEEIDGTQSLEVHDNQESKEIDEKQSLEVHEEETEEIDGTQSLEVHDNQESKEIDEKQSLEVHEEEETEEIDGTQSLEVHDKQESEEIDGTQSLDVHDKQESEQIDGTQSIDVDETQDLEVHDKQENEQMDKTQDLEVHDKQENEQMDKTQDLEVHDKQEIKNHEEIYGTQESNETKESGEIDGTQDRIVVHEKQEHGDHKEKQSEEFDGTQESLGAYEKQKRGEVDGTLESIEVNEKQESEEINGTHESIETHEKQENGEIEDQEEIDGTPDIIEDHENQERREIDRTQDNIEVHEALESEKIDGTLIGSFDLKKQESDEIKDKEEMNGTQGSIEAQESGEYDGTQDLEVHKKQESEDIDETQDSIDINENQESGEIDITLGSFDNKKQESEKIKDHKESYGTQESIEAHEKQESEEFDETPDIIEAQESGDMDGTQESEDSVDNKKQESEEIKDHEEINGTQQSKDFDGTQKSIESKESEDIDGTQDLEVHKKQEREDIDGTPESIEAQERGEMDGTQSLEVHDNQESKEIDEKQSLEVHEEEKTEEIDGTQSLEVHDKQESEEIDGTQSLDVHDKQESEEVDGTQSIEVHDNQESEKIDGTQSIGVHDKQEKIDGTQSLKVPEKQDIDRTQQSIVAQESGEMDGKQDLDVHENQESEEVDGTQDIIEAKKSGEMDGTQEISEIDGTQDLENEESVEAQESREMDGTQEIGEIDGAQDLEVLANQESEEVDGTQESIKAQESGEIDGTQDSIKAQESGEMDGTQESGEIDGTQDLKVLKKLESEEVDGTQESIDAQESGEMNGTQESEEIDGTQDLEVLKKQESGEVDGTQESIEAQESGEMNETQENEEIDGTQDLENEESVEAQESREMDGTQEIGEIDGAQDLEVLANQESEEVDGTQESIKAQESGEIDGTQDSIKAQESGEMDGTQESGEIDGTQDLKVLKKLESEEVDGTQESIDAQESGEMNGTQESEEIDGTQDLEVLKKQESGEVDGTQESIEAQESGEMNETQENEKINGIQESEEIFGTQDLEVQEKQEIENHEKIDGTQESNEAKESGEINGTQDRIVVHEKQEHEDIEDHEEKQSEEVDGTPESLGAYEKQKRGEVDGTLESEEINGTQDLEVQEKQEIVNHEEIDGTQESNETKESGEIDGTQDRIVVHEKQEHEDIEDHKEKQSEEFDGTPESLGAYEMQKIGEMDGIQESEEINGTQDLEVQEKQEIENHEEIDGTQESNETKESGEIDGTQDRIVVHEKQEHEDHKEKQSEEFDGTQESLGAYEKQKRGEVDGTLENEEMNGTQDFEVQEKQEIENHEEIDGTQESNEAKDHEEIDRTQDRIVVHEKQEHEYHKEKQSEEFDGTQESLGAYEKQKWGEVDGTLEIIEVNEKQESEEINGTHESIEAHEKQKNGDIEDQEVIDGTPDIIEVNENQERGEIDRTQDIIEVHEALESEEIDGTLGSFDLKKQESEEIKDKEEINGTQESGEYDGTQDIEVHEKQESEDIDETQNSIGINENQESREIDITLGSFENKKQESENLKDHEEIYGTQESIEAHEKQESEEFDETPDIIEAQESGDMDGTQESEDIDGPLDSVDNKKQESEEIKDHELINGTQESEDIDGTQESIDHKKQESEEFDETPDIIEAQESGDMDGTQEGEDIDGPLDSVDNKKQESEEIKDHELINGTQESEDIDGTQDLEVHKKQDSEEIDGTQDLEVHEKQDSEEVDGTQDLEVHKKQDSEEIDGTQDLEVHEKRDSEEVDGTQDLEVHKKQENEDIDGTPRSIEAQECVEMDGTQDSEEIDGPQDLEVEENQESGEIDGTQGSIEVHEKQESKVNKATLDCVEVHEKPLSEKIDKKPESFDKDKKLDYWFNEVYKKGYQIAEQIKDQHIETLKNSNCEDEEDGVSLMSTHMATINRNDEINKENLEGKFDFNNGTEIEESLQSQIESDNEDPKIISSENKIDLDIVDKSNNEGEGSRSVSEQRIPSQDAASIELRRENNEDAQIDGIENGYNRKEDIQSKTKIQSERYFMKESASRQTGTSVEINSINSIPECSDNISTVSNKSLAETVRQTDTDYIITRKRKLPSEFESTCPVNNKKLLMDINDTVRGFFKVRDYVNKRSIDPVTLKKNLIQGYVRNFFRRNNETTSNLQQKDIIIDNMGNFEAVKLLKKQQVKYFVHETKNDEIKDLVNATWKARSEQLDEDISGSTSKDLQNGQNMKKLTDGNINSIEFEQAEVAVYESDEESESHPGYEIVIFGQHNLDESNDAGLGRDHPTENVNVSRKIDTIVDSVVTTVTDLVQQETNICREESQNHDDQECIIKNIADLSNRTKEQTQPVAQTSESEKDSNNKTIREEEHICQNLADEIPRRECYILKINDEVGRNTAIITDDVDCVKIADNEMIIVQELEDHDSVKPEEQMDALIDDKQDQILTRIEQNNIVDIDGNGTRDEDPIQTQTNVEESENSNIQVTDLQQDLIATQAELMDLEKKDEEEILEGMNVEPNLAATLSKFNEIKKFGETQDSMATDNPDLIDTQPYSDASETTEQLEPVTIVNDGKLDKSNVKELEKSVTNVNHCELDESVVEEPEELVTIVNHCELNESVVEEPEESVKIVNHCELNESVVEEPEESVTIVNHCELNESVVEEPEELVKIVNHCELDESVVEEPEELVTIVNHCELNESVVEEPEESIKIVNHCKLNESVVEEPEESVMIVNHGELDESVVASNISHGNVFEDTLVNIDEINSDDTTFTENTTCRTQSPKDCLPDMYNRNNEETIISIVNDGEFDESVVASNISHGNVFEDTLLNIDEIKSDDTIRDNYVKQPSNSTTLNGVTVEQLFKETSSTCSKNTYKFTTRTQSKSHQEGNLNKNESPKNCQPNMDATSIQETILSDALNSEDSASLFDNHQEDFGEKKISAVLEQIDDSSKENSEDGSPTKHSQDTVEYNQESGLPGNKDESKIDDNGQELPIVGEDSFVFDFSNTSDCEDSEKLMIDLNTGKDDTSQYDSDEKVAEDVDVSNESNIIISDSTENGKSDFEEIIRDTTNKSELEVDNKRSVNLTENDTGTGDHLAGKVTKIFTSFMNRLKSESGTDEIERVRNTSGNYGDDKTNYSTYTLPDFDISSDGSLLKSESRSRESSVEFVCTGPVTPSADLCNEDSDSLPEVEFLRASPAKHPIVKEEKSGDDSGLESGIDVTDKVDDVIDQNCKKLIVGLPSTPVKNEQIKAVFHVSDSSSLENNTPPIQRCITPVKFRESTPSKFKLKLKKLDAVEESPRKKSLRKKKKDPSPKKQKSPIKIPIEPDESPNKRPSRKKKTDTSSEKEKTPVHDGEIPGKGEGRKRKLYQSPKTCQTPEKKKDNPSKKKKMTQEKRRLSDLIEIWTDDDSESEMVSRSSIVKTEQNEGHDDEPSYEVATAESSSPTDDTSQKDCSDGYEWCSQETRTTEKDAVQGTQSSISDIDNIHSEESTDCNTPPCQQTLIPDDQISELSFSNTVVTDSVTEDESICLERLPGLVPSDQTPTTATSYDENEADLDNDHTDGEMSSVKEIDHRDIQCTFEDVATDDDDNEDIGNIVNFLENETVCYSDLHEDQRSLSGQSHTGDDYPSVDRQLSPTYEMEREPVLGVKYGFLSESEEKSTDYDNLRNNSECDYFKNGMETSSPNEFEKVTLRRLQNLEKKLHEKSLNRQHVTSMETGTPNISRSDETVLYYDDESGPTVHIEKVGGNFAGDFNPCSDDEYNDIDSGTPLSLQFGSSSLNMPALNDEVRDPHHVEERMEDSTNSSAANKENVLGHHRTSPDISNRINYSQSLEGSSIEYQEDDGNFDQRQNEGYNDKSIDVLYERNRNSLTSSYPQNIKEEIKSPEEIMPKRKAKNLLEKLRAKKMRLSLPKATIPLEVKENDGQVAGPSQIRPHTPAMSGDLDRCKEVVLKLRKSLSKEKKMKNQQRVEVWKQELTELESKLCSPKVTVAVVGTTGAGKSSLMNAIIDHYNVLPTSGTQACTAVVVKIESNSTSDLFEADIEFLSKEEWENELQLLKKDLTDKNGKIKKVKPDPETEAGVAFLKMRAVYGKFETFEQLSRPTPVTRCLGKIETVKSRCSSTFRNKIDKYIENTSSKTGGQYWPIIKSVTIRIPHCSVCSNGCTLVDLPGVRDSNAARDRIAKDYLKNCSVILVVAEVHRASTSKTAKELLGDNFRRQLLMDGQYGNVAFICTKNDVLQPSELIRELSLDEQTDSIEENLNLMMIKMDELKHTERTLKEEIQWLLVDINTLTNGVDELQKDITEITELVSLVDTQEENEQLEELRSDLQRKSVKLSLKQQAADAKRLKVDKIQSQINQLIIEMNHKRKMINMICAKARTIFSRNAIKKDYKAGVREMKRKAKMTQEEIEEDEEDDYVSDEDDNDITRSCDNLQVFCVSSSEYQKLNNRLTDDGPPMVFDDAKDTEIPAVRQFIKQISNQKREEATKRLIQNLAVFIYDIQNYLTENGLTNKNDRFTVQSAVADFSSRLHEELSPILDNLQQDVGHELDSSIAAQLNRGVEVAVNSAVDTCKGWGSAVKKEDKNQGGLCFSTYKATVRRYGNFQSPTAGLIDFNENLAEPLTTSISIVWTKFFSVDLWNLLERYKLRILSTLRSFTGKLCGELLSCNVSRNQLDTAQRQFHLISETKLTEMIRNLQEFVIERQRDMNRMFPPTIQDHLKTTYEDCKNDSGKGLFQRMKNKMEGGVDNERPNMFQSASSTLLAQLEQLMNEVIHKVKDVCSTLCLNLQAVFEPLWNSCEASKQLKSTLFKEITEASLVMSSLCRTAGVQLPVRSAASTRETIHLPGTPLHGTSIMTDVNRMVPSASQQSLYANRVVELPGCSVTSIASNRSDPGQQQNQLMNIASPAMSTGIPGKPVRRNSAVEIPDCGRRAMNRMPITSTFSPANISQNNQVQHNSKENLTHGKESFNFMMNTSNSRPAQVTVEQPKTSVVQNHQSIVQNQGQKSGNTTPKYVSVLPGKHGHVTYRKQTGSQDPTNTCTQGRKGKPGNNRVNEVPLIPTHGRRSVDGGHGPISLVPQISESTLPVLSSTIVRLRNFGGNPVTGHSTLTSIPVSTVSQTHGTRHTNSLPSPVSGRQNVGTSLVSQPSIEQPVVPTSCMNSPTFPFHSVSQPSDFVLEQKTNNSYVMKTPSCISSGHPLIPGKYVPVTTSVSLPPVQGRPYLSTNVPRLVNPAQITSVHKTSTQSLHTGQHAGQHTGQHRSRSTTHKFVKYPDHSTGGNTSEIPVSVNVQRPLSPIVQTTRTCQTKKSVTQSSAVTKSYSSQKSSQVSSAGIDKLLSTTNVTNSKSSRNVNPATSAASQNSRLHETKSQEYISSHEKAIEDIRGNVWRLGKRKQSQGSRSSLNPNISTSVVFNTPVRIKTEASEESGPSKRRRPQKDKPVVITISDSDSDFTD
ncbi:titin homolog isoform X3 [Mytilus edulis]|uniref:titin homolog isoform X3 n=1 Tax=Mytilus edulis TaxID=6550 RepID=UPI0039EEC5A2